MFRRFFAGCALSAACVVSQPFTARADTAIAAPSPSPSPAALPEIGRVVTSDRRLEPIGSTSRPTFVVDRARIEADGARTVADALRDVPGVQLFRYGAFGAQVDYGIRGALSSQTLVLVDGQPVADPTTGAAYLEDLSTNGVRRIEVVESGTSTLYGTSAAGGVINVITDVPRGAYLAASSGSFGDRDVRVSAGDGVVGVSFERHVATNDFAYPALRYGPGGCSFTPPPCAFPAGTRTNAYGDASVLRFSSDVPLGDGVRVRARLDASQLHDGVPGELTLPTPATVQPLSANGGLFEIERVRGVSTLTLDVSGSQQRLAYADPSFGEDDVFSGRTQLSLRDAVAGARTDAVFGVDLARESGNFTFPGYVVPTAPPVTVPPSATGAAQSQAAAYVQAGYTLGKARFVAGLRGENDAPDGGVVAPAFGAAFGLGGGFKLAGNVGESFRVPTLQDLYYPGFSNPSLAPERAQNADATLAFDGSSGTLSAGWFTRNGSNFIVYDPVANKPVNATRAQTAGFTVAGRTRPVDGLAFEASFTDLYRALDVTTGARLPRNPVGQGFVGLTHAFGNGAFAYGMRFGAAGSDGDDKANVAPPVTGTYDAWSSLDAYVRFKLARGAVLSVRGFNLGDDRAAPIFGYPSPGRAFAVELSTR